MRFYLDYPQSCYYTCAVPQFLIDGGLSFNNYSRHGGGMSPDYADEALVSALEAFIARLGSRYDADPRVAYVQLGLLGFWGEWHTYPHNSWIPAATRTRVIAAFAYAFNTTQLQLRDPSDYPGASAHPGAAARFGLHDDSFAYSTLDGAYNGGVSTGWYFWPKVLAKGVADFWGVGVMGGELRPELQDEAFEDDYPANTQYKQARAALALPATRFRPPRLLPQPPDVPTCRLVLPPEPRATPRPSGRTSATASA